MSVYMAFASSESSGLKGIVLILYWDWLSTWAAFLTFVLKFIWGSLKDFWPIDVLRSFEDFWPVDDLWPSEDFFSDFVEIIIDLRDFLSSSFYSSISLNFAESTSDDDFEASFIWFIVSLF